MRINNPINHPTAFYRRQEALDVGGYSELRYMQDYDLFARMLVHGARFANMPDAVVAFRADERMYARRRSRDMTACERALQDNLRSYGLISTPRMWVNLGMRQGFRRLPGPLLRSAHRWLFTQGRRGDPAWPRIARGGRVRRDLVAMLSRQARFAARSVRDILRDPTRARGFVRMLRTLGHSTTALRVPWLPFALVDELTGAVGSGTRVFEYGGGGSTLWFLDRGAQVITVEHDDAWAAELLGHTGSSRDFALVRHPAGEQYVGAIDRYPDGYFDVVVVDGRDRVRCARAAMAKVRPGGLLILDDVDRPRYGSVFATVPWPSRTIVGFAPCKPTLAYTAVFSRPVD